MKKILIVLLTLALLSSSFTVSARVLEDGELTSLQENVVVGGAAANGIPLEFIGGDAGWAQRAIYQGEYMQLDGFKIVLSNVQLAEGGQIALSFCGNDGSINPWVDANTLMFCVTTNTTDHRNADWNAPNGYMYVRQLPDVFNEKPYIAGTGPVKLSAPLGKEITIEFKKEGTNWKFIVNGTALIISNAVMSQYMKFGLEEILWTIGDAPKAGYTNSYTVKYVSPLPGQEDEVPTSTTSQPATQGTDSPTTSPSSNSDTTPSSSNSDTTDSSNLDSTNVTTDGPTTPSITTPTEDNLQVGRNTGSEKSNKTALIVTIVVTAVIVLGCVGVILFLLLKKKSEVEANTDNQ